MLLILNHQHVEQLLSYDACIDLMRQALSALSQGRAFQPLRTVVRSPHVQGLMGLMPSSLITDHSILGLKAICVFPGNAERNLDLHQGAVLLYDSETGQLRALINASAITAIRTAAVSALATQALAQPNANTLAIIGSGVQARSHLAAIAASRPLERVHIVSRNPQRAAAMVAECAPRYDFPIVAGQSIEQAVRESQIIVTATSSDTPVLQRDWLQAGAHVNAVGACTPNARELDSATMAAARIVVDRRESTINEAGDYVIPAREGLIGPDQIVAELGDLLVGTSQGRTSDQEITVFKSLGLAIEDLVAADYVYQQAQTQQVGAWLNFD